MTNIRLPGGVHAVVPIDDLTGFAISKANNLYYYCHNGGIYQNVGTASANNIDSIREALDRAKEQAIKD